MVFFIGLSARSQASAETTQLLPPYQREYTYKSEARELEVSLKYTYLSGFYGEMMVEMKAETDEATLKKFEKYCKKSIDSASIGEVIFVTRTYSDPQDANKSGIQSFTIKLPKFYKNKDVAVIPFEDYRSPQKVKECTVDEDGCINFIGNNNAYAYAIIYNGVYKDIILIGIILLVVLIICVLVNIICLRKDNPYYKEKKVQKAINKKKAEHKKNKRLAQQLKREKEKMKRNNRPQ